MLQGVRLPENNGEWGDVQCTLEGLRPAFKADSSPAALLNELMTLAVECADWWNSRNRSSGAPALLCRHLSHPAGGLPIRGAIGNLAALHSKCFLIARALTACLLLDAGAKRPPSKPSSAANPAAKRQQSVVRSQSPSPVPGGSDGLLGGLSVRRATLCMDRDLGPVHCT